jgi:hypothetical protein
VFIQRQTKNGRWRKTIIFIAARSKFKYSIRPACRGHFFSIVFVGFLLESSSSALQSKSAAAHCCIVLLCGGRAARWSIRETSWKKRVEIYWPSLDPPTDRRSAAAALQSGHNQLPTTGEPAQNAASLCVCKASIIRNQLSREKAECTTPRHFWTFEFAQQPEQTIKPFYINSFNFRSQEMKTPTCE